MPNLILASDSPRRKELLKKLNIPFTTCSPNVNETISNELLPSDIVMLLAKRKAAAVARQHPDSVVIGADTIVVSNGKVLGKPENRQKAMQMLTQLSGSTHSVYTGIALLCGESEELFYEKTEVQFWELSKENIQQYLDSGEPFDKAGAYGIQGRGALFVKAISGDYYSVVGLPISRLSRVLSAMGLTSS